METAEFYPILWAKSDPYKSLRAHMRETAIVAGCLVTESCIGMPYVPVDQYLGLDRCSTEKLVMYLAGLHDLGKAHPCFICKISSDKIKDYFVHHPELAYVNLNRVADYRHEQGSASAARRIWKEKKRFDRRTISALSAILRLHHQGKKGEDVGLEEEEWPAGRKWMYQQDLLEQWLWKWLNPPRISLRSAKQADAACMVITAIVILSDWIASGTFFENTTGNESESRLRQLTARFLKASNMIPDAFPKAKNFCDLWRQIKPDHMRPIQKSLDQYYSAGNEIPLLTILEAPMGEGKTEAGIFAAFRMMYAYHKQGIYMALPTAATANQMKQRMADLFQQHGCSDVMLLHSGAWMVENRFVLSKEENNGTDPLTQAEQWLTTPKRGLLASAAVGTVDQAMMAAMRVRYGMLRLGGLGSKVLVIDEIHAYDAYMTDILLRLLDWCRAMQIPVVLLSATLPSARKAMILERYGGVDVLPKAYPQITMAYPNGKVAFETVDGSFQHNTVALQILPYLGKVEKIVELALKKVEDGGCLCILLNTVLEAQKVYKLLLSKVEEGTTCLLFHSRFSMARRNEIEKQCIDWFGPGGQRPQKAILVATQVVEQSLDIDMDAMITAIAPIDLLLQRMGRMHRHMDTPRPTSLSKPVLTILTPDGDHYGPTEKVYYRLLLERTRQAIEKAEKVSIPVDIPALVEEVYDESFRKADDLETFWKRSIHEELQVGEGRQIELNPPQTNSFGLADLAASPILGDEEDGLLAARTRLGTPSKRVAILPSNLFVKLQNVLDHRCRPTAELSRQVLQYSVAVPETTLKANGILLGDKILCGTGRLYGVIALPAEKNGEVPPTQTIRSVMDHAFITMDRELGFVIEQKEQ